MVHKKFVPKLWIGSATPPPLRKISQKKVSFFFVWLPLLECIIFFYFLLLNAFLSIFKCEILMGHDTVQGPVELPRDLEDGELLHGLDARHQQALQGHCQGQNHEMVWHIGRPFCHNNTFFSLFFFFSFNTVECHLRRVHRHRDVVRGAVGDRLRLEGRLL